MTFTAPADWKKEAGSGMYRMYVRTNNTPTTKPIGTQILPYPNIQYISAPYSTGSDPFAIWTQGRNSNKVVFSANRAFEKLGSASAGPSHAHNLKGAGAAVSLSSGNLALSVGGPAVPSRGVGVAPTFTYNSQSRNEGPLGMGWSSNLFARLYVGWTDGSVLYADGSGARYLFDYDNGSYQGPPELHTTLNTSGTDFILKTRNQLTYTFDAVGKLRTVQDRNANTTLYNYDGEEKLASVVSASNTTTTLSWEENGNFLTGVTDPAGRTMTFSRDTTGDLTAIVDSMNNTTTLTYDAGHNLTGFKDARGYTTGFAYANDKVVKITDPSPLSYQTNFTYNRAGAVVDGPRTDVTDVTTYNINPDGLVSEAIDPPGYALSDGSRWQYRQKISLNTGALGLTAGVSAAHNLHISGASVFNEVGTNKFWQRVSSVKGYLAFGNVDSSTPLSYAIKDWDYGQRDAYLDIQDTFNADGDTDIYVYYGYMSGGAYPKGPGDFAGAYDSNTKAAYSMTDDPSSSTTQDLSANNNDLTKFAPDQPGQTVGKTGKAQSFDGTDDRARAVDSNSLDIAGSVSLSAWVKLDSTIASQPLSYSYIFEKGAGTGSTRNYGLYLSRSNGYAVFSAYKSDGSGFAFYTSFPASALDDLGWHHLASVWDGSVARLYLDGSEESSSSGVGPLITNTTYMAFGSNGIGTNGFYKGSVDDAGVSNTARSANWVKLTYRSVDGQDDIGAHGAGHYIEVAAPEGVTSYRYDADRNQTALTLANGAVTTSAYDAGGNLLTETDPMGAITRYAYNAKNDVVSTTDALGRNTAYSYDTTGNLTKKINADNTSETYEYNAFGQRTRTVNARGYDTNYTYTNLGRLAKEIRSDDSSTTHEYDLAGSETTTTDALGNKTVNTYDFLGRLTQVTYPGGGKTFYEYDSVGNQTKESRLADLAIADMEADESWTGGAADTSNSVQGVQGRKVTSISGVPASASRSLSLDLGSEDTATGYIDEWVYVPDVDDLQVTSPIQISFDSTSGSYSYTVFHASLLDGWNQLHIAKTDFTVFGSPSWTNITNMSNAVTSASSRTANVTFDDLRLVANKRLVKSLGYDILGRLTAESDALESTTTHQYDAAGNMTLEIDPIGGRLAYTYDALNRQVTEVTASDDSSATEKASYDSVGNVISESQDSSDSEDASGATTYQYDVGGRMKSSIDSENETMAYEYNALSQVTTETDSEGNITVHNYDSLGRITTETIITTETEPANSSTVYQYDAAGNVITVIPAEGPVVVSVFDELNRVQTQTDGTDTITHEYDLAGRETTTVSSGVGTMTMAYNESGKKIAETDASDAVTSYKYDTQGNLIQLTDASGSVNYQYNEAGEQIKVVDFEGNIENKILDQNSNPTEIKAAGEQTSYAYNTQSLAVASVAINEATTTFSYGGRGNRIKMVQPNGVRTIYKYNSGNGLTSLDTSTSTGVRLLKYTYGIGNKGNITTETLSGVGTSNYRYDGKRQLIYWKDTNGVETTYTYNASGDRTKISKLTGITNCVYDSYHRLKSVTDASGTTTYIYSSKGLLTQKTTPSGTYTYTNDSKGQLTAIAGPGVSVAMAYNVAGQLNTLTVNGTTKRFVYANNKLAAEKNASGTTIATYVYDRLGLPLSIKKNGATYFFHLNHRGDVRKITDSNQNVVAEYTYDPWGKVLSETGSFLGEQPLRYAGLYYEPTLALYVHALYDPQVARQLGARTRWNANNPLAPISVKLSIRKRFSQAFNNKLGTRIKHIFPSNAYGGASFTRKTIAIKPSAQMAGRTMMKAASWNEENNYLYSRRAYFDSWGEDRVNLMVDELRATVEFGMYRDGKLRESARESYAWGWTRTDPFGDWIAKSNDPDFTFEALGQARGASFDFTGSFYINSRDWFSHLVGKEALHHQHKIHVEISGCPQAPVYYGVRYTGEMVWYLPHSNDAWYYDVNPD